MKRNNLFCWLSIYLIKKIWHGNLGASYKKKYNVICRFYPPCSNYTIKALEKYGFIKGWRLAYKRIKSCNDKNTESCVDYP